MEKGKLTPPVIYLELIKFNNPMDEGILFCALWMKAIQWKNDFTFTIEQAKQELNMSKGQYVKIMKQFEKHGIILPIRAKNNTRKFQINFRSLAVKGAIFELIKPFAVKQYRVIFRQLALKYPVKVIKNLSRYEDEMNSCKDTTTPYFEDYEAFGELIIREGILFRVVSLTPIYFNEFQELCEYFYKSFDDPKPDILEFIEKIITNKYLVKQYSSMKKLLSDKLKIEVDKELKAREKQVKSTVHEVVILPASPKTVNQKPPF